MAKTQTNRFSGLIDTNLKKNRFSGLLETPEQPKVEQQGEVVPIRRDKLPGLWDYDKRLDELLGDGNLDDFIPMDVKYDFGRIIKMTEKPSETEDKIKLSILYKSIADIDPKISFNLMDELNKVVIGEPSTPTKAWGRIKERYQTGKSQVQMMDLGFDILGDTWKNWEKYDENIKNIQKLQSGMSDDQRKEFRAWWEKILGATAEQLPIMWQALREAPEGAIAGGLLFGLTSATLAAASPTVGEEALVPAITMKGVTLGAGVRGAMRIGQLEAGGMFLELAETKDQYGNRIDPKIAVVSSMAVGSINGAIELAEWAVLLKTFGITGNLFNKSVGKVTKKLFAEGTIKEVLARKVAQYGIALSAEVLQEVEQETSNIVFGELAKELNNARKGTDFKPITAEALKARYTEVTLESARAFGLLVLPGTTVSGIIELATQKPKAAAEAVKPAEGKRAELEIKAPEKDVIKDVAEKFDISEDKAKAILERQAELQQQKAVEEAKPPVAEKVEVLKAEKPVEKKITPKDVSPIIEPELTKQEEADIAQLEAEIEEPFVMERVKGTGFVIKERATGKEAAIVPKRKAAQAKLVELNEKDKEIKGTRRMPKLLTDKASVGQLITEAKALKASLKKAAQAARKAYSEGKKEGIEKVKDYYRGLRLRERARKQLKQRIDKAVKTIKKEIPTSVDFSYREAIDALRSGIDPSFRAEKTLESREQTKEFLSRKPEAIKDMPVALMKKLSKKPLNDYTVADLEEIASEIEELKQQGKLKRGLQLAQKERKLNEQKQQMIENITKGEPIKSESKPVVHSTTKEGLVKTAHIKERAWTLRPSRIFDMLDRGKSFLGEAHRFFVDKVNDAVNTKLRKEGIRKDDGLAKMKDLGVSPGTLAQTRIIDDVKYTVDEMIGIYNANKNRLAKLAIMYGNNLKEPTIKKIIDNLTESEKAWGDYIIEDYDKNYSRLRREVIEVENRDMGYEENYTPIRRTEIDYTTHTEEIIDAILHKEHLRKAYAEKGMTISRKNVPPEFQKPIRVDATGVWIEQIGKQEQYINLAGLVKDMHKIISDRDFSNAVEQNFGKEFNKVIRNYVDRVANPNVYKSYNLLENWSRQLRQNTAVAYLAYNLLTMAKQLPSLLLYLPDAGVTHLISSAMEFTSRPIQLIKSVREKDPQVKTRAIERELEELKQRKPEMHSELLAKFGRAGMEGIYLFDTVARTIGWNAVYQKMLSSGMSETEAIRQAQNTTLRTQPAAAAKDLAQVYASNEFFNWFTMFTNQLNQIYNITTYDIFASWKNAEYAKSGLAFTSISLAALFIYALSHKKVPTTPEDFADAASEQAINSIPVIGKSIMTGKRMWGDNEPPVFKLPKASGKIAGKIREGKDLTANDIDSLIEGIAVTTGIPYIGPKRVIRTVKTGEVKELFGAKKKGRKTDFGGIAD